MGIIDVDLKGIAEGGAKLVDSISGLFNADEKAKVEIAKLVNSNLDKTLQSVMNSADNATKRLESDNTSGEKSTKTIRPKLAMFWTVFFALIIITVLIGTFVTKFTAEEIEVLQTIFYVVLAINISIISFYFTSKGFENINKLKGLFNFSDKMVPKSTASGMSEKCLGCGSKGVLPNQFYCKKCTGE